MKMLLLLLKIGHEQLVRRTTLSNQARRKIQKHLLDLPFSLFFDLNILVSIVNKQLYNNIFSDNYINDQMTTPTQRSKNI